RIALHPVGFDINRVELTLGNVGVVALELLLGAQLHAEVGHLALAALAVLAGAVFALVDRALGTTPDIFAHTAVDFILGFCTLCHRVLYVDRVEETRPPMRRKKLSTLTGPFPKRWKRDHGSRNASRAEMARAQVGS